MTEIGIGELQGLELDILKHFHDYCRENGIRYYLYAGTLLGAVRHRGFIPWDDDIDLCLPRPDYEKLWTLTRTRPVAPHLELRSARVRDGYNAPFFKLVDTRTDGHEDYLRDEIRSGVWVDLFPMDGLPENAEERAAHLAALKKTQRTMEKVVRTYRLCANPLRLAKRAALWCVYAGRDYRALANGQDALARKYPCDLSGDVAVAVFDGWKRVFRRDWFSRTVLLPFEQYEFCAPAEYDKVLKYLYGDYMTPPPPEQRVPHHSYTAWWVDESKRDGTEEG